MKLKYIVLTLAAIVFAACEQQVIDLEPAPIPPPDTSCEDAIAGTASFTKFVAIGTSYSAGFQSGALYNEGQANSLPAILNKQFECVGAGVFKQPNIGTENGFNIFIPGNPIGTVPTDFTVLGKLRLKGSPPAPAPTQTHNDFTALPNPQVNPGFIYTGAKNELGNFSVQAMQLGQIIHPTVGGMAGDWANSSNPYFNPFYARIASNPGTSTMFGDYIASLTNGGTFFMSWLGMDDVLLYAVFGADPAKAPLTDLGTFTALYNSSIDGILANPTLKGVVLNIPDIFSMPHFKLVPYNAIPLDQATADYANSNFAGYNLVLDALKGAPFNYSAAEVDARKIYYVAGQNKILISDESVNDYGDEFDMIQQAGFISAGQRAQLVPYEQVRQATSSDIFPLAAGSVLGKLADPNNPASVIGVALPLEDQYCILPSEKTAINARLGEFNTAIKQKVDANAARIAFVDINANLLSFAAAGAAVVDGVTLTPSLAPPAGIYSEEGIHPNSRGYAFISNFVIDAINAKFGSTIPKANVGAYSGTALPQ